MTFAEPPYGRRALTVDEALAEYRTAKERRDSRRIHAAARALRDARTAELRAELSPQPKPKAGLLERFWGFLSWK